MTFKHLENAIKAYNKTNEEFDGNMYEILAKSKKKQTKQKKEEK